MGPQSASTPSGSEDPFLLPSPPSNRCGSPSRRTTKLAHPSATESASKPNTKSHHNNSRNNDSVTNIDANLPCKKTQTTKLFFFAVCHFRSFAFWLVMYSLNYVVFLTV